MEKLRSWDDGNPAGEPFEERTFSGTEFSGYTQEPLTEVFVELRSAPVDHCSKRRVKAPFIIRVVVKY
jgi:hypothetical protein